MSRRSPRLAKRRVDPTWFNGPEYVETFGPEVADIATLAGMTPDPEQQMFLDGLFGIRPDGKSAAFENAIIGPRQVLGKTGTIKMAELGWLYVTEQRLIVHSAHELDTTEGAFNDLRDLIESTPQLARHLDRSVGKVDSPGIMSGNGKWSIFALGAEGQKLQVKYKARTATGGRGLTGNKIVLDEGFALTRAMIGSLYPTLTVVPDPQVLIGSSAGLLMSEVLRSIRNRGRAGGDPRLLYAEWGDDWKRLGGCRLPHCDHARPPNNPPGCVLDDATRWRRFMTTLGRRTSEETVRDMRRSMPPDEFAREFMVWWDDPPTGDSDGVIDIRKWGTPTSDGGCKDPAAPAPSRVRLVVDVAPDRRSATVAAAGEAPGGKTLTIVETKPGSDWVVQALKHLTANRDVAGPVGLVESAQAGALIPDLNAERIPWAPISGVQAGQACAWFIEAVKNGQVVHVGQMELDRAVGNATTRFTAAESEKWDRRDPTIDISPVVAASYAAFLWSLLPKTPPASPRRASNQTAPARRPTTAGFSPRTSGF